MPFIKFSNMFEFGRVVLKFCIAIVSYLWKIIEALYGLIIIGLFSNIDKKKKEERPTDEMKPKPYSSIPGPKAYPIIGSLHNYFGKNKKYDLNRLHRNGLSKYNEYGPIVKETFPFERDIVWLFNPEDIKNMYASEGKYPYRRSHLALEYYRLQNPEKYNNGGLLPTNGSAWGTLRQSAQKPLSKASTISNMMPEIDRVTIDFVEMLSEGEHDIFNHKNFLDELKKYFLEVTGVFTLGVRLGAIKKKLSKNSVPYQLIEAAFCTNSNILPTDNGLMLWKLFETDEYKKIRKSQEYIEATIQKHYQKISSSDQCNEAGLLSQYLSSEKLHIKDSLALAADMLLAGIDTSSYTTGFLLYEVGMNKQILDKLFNDINEIICTDDHIDHESKLDDYIKKFSYGKQVLKEALRLHPVSVGTSRMLENDGVFSGYKVPKGTLLVSQNQITSRLSDYFPFGDPNEFNPDRWNRDKDLKMNAIHPFLSLPFGFGKRMCIGRRMAEQSILALMFRIFQTFEVEWIGKDDLDCKSLLINEPDGDLEFVFKRR